MAASEQTVELVSTKEIELFLPLMREIDFGDAFLLLMLHWCGIGKRSRPLEYWQVFLLRAKSHIVGVSGLYRQPGIPSHICWVGWFAIRPQFRRQGFGSAAIHQLRDTARIAGSTELWVYTGSHDDAARAFYISLGFETLGSASDYARGKTLDDSDIVLRLQRAFPDPSSTVSGLSLTIQCWSGFTGDFRVAQRAPDTVVRIVTENSRGG